MTANRIRLLEFIGSSKRTFNIPVYQRNYDWKAEHCKRLFLDIEHIASTGFQIEHFLGTIVYVTGLVQPNFLEFIVIDGQQRITSIMLLIKAIYDSISDTDLREDILETYLTNKRAPEDLRIKLKPIESDMDSYKRIFTEEKINNKSNISKNYSLFKQLVSKSIYPVEELYRALSYVEIVYIELEQHKKSENPQLIFESLNSTGLTLTQADLIRNFLLMNHSYEEQNRLFKKYWVNIEYFLPNAVISDFVRDYLTMKNGSIPKKDNVYKEFKEYINDNDNYNEEKILKELLLYAKYYSWLLNCNTDDDSLNELLQQLQQMKSTVTYPPLLYIFEDCFSKQIISIDIVNDVIKIILSYLFRRLICGYPTNALNKVFSSLSIELDKKVPSKEDYLDAVTLFFATKAGSALFPRKDEFKRAFIIKDLYKTNVDKYTLYQLERHNNKEIVDLNEEITVEHIMPQTLTPMWKIDLGKQYEEIHKEYLHTIGNLTLTAYNPNLSNKRFTDKKETLKNSNISISRNVVKYNEWNIDSIKDRASRLFETARNIWSLPDKYEFELDQTISYDVDYNIMDDINVTGEKPRQLVIYDTVYNVSTWKDILREICKQLYDLDSQLFETFLKHKDFEGRERRIIASSSDGMNSPYEVAEDIYIETTLNANAILNYCKLIAEKYEMLDDIYFRLRLR